MTINCQTVFASDIFISEASLHCQTSYKSQNDCTYACHDGLSCSGIMVEKPIVFKFGWLKFKETKNNYDFDKITLVLIQKGQNIKVILYFANVTDFNSQVTK